MLNTYNELNYSLLKSGFFVDENKNDDTRIQKSEEFIKNPLSKSILFSNATIEEILGLERS